MMRAIFTKLLGATDHNGSRVKATDNDGNSVTLGWRCDLSSNSNHDRVARALCVKMGWWGDLQVGDAAETGNVYVRIDATRILSIPHSERVKC